MTNLREAQVHITGTRPLLWHHFGSEAIPVSGRKERSGVAGNDPHEWRTTVLMVPDTRQLYLKNTAIFGCLRDAARHIKKGRGTLQPAIAATLQVVEDVRYLDRFVPPEPLPTDPTAPVYLDIQSVKNPATRARNVRYRVAASPGWELTFHILWDVTIVSTGEMQAVVHDAGRLAGLGDGRTIGDGRFTLNTFTVLENVTPAGGLLA